MVSGHSLHRKSRGGALLVSGRQPALECAAFHSGIAASMPTSHNAPMSPTARYALDVAQGALFEDAAQTAAIRRFQRLYDELMARENQQKTPLDWLKRPFLPHRTALIKGLYIHGGVGRGKTYMMDVFFESLPLQCKMRTHFHRFMQRVHAELRNLKQQKNPLETVACIIAREARVLCFDEFFVSDIGDAMILGGLLAHLMEEGVVLVATSNIEPDLLYQNGLQRERFMPAIALLKASNEIVHLDAGIDYRLRRLKQASVYHHPLDESAQAAMSQCFRRMLTEHAHAAEGGFVEILGRQIPVLAVFDDVIWFEFEDLCGGPRSAYDYIELAKIYHAILLSNVPRLDDSTDDKARRFISLVDELYDRNVKLILSAAVELPELYQGRGLAFVFERTRSRLLEMQSEDYLGREHRP
jgi:cell division protein ZapE